MKEKILKDLHKIKVNEILNIKENVNLVDSGTIEDIKISGNDATIIINLVPLDIGKKEAAILQDLIVKKLKKPFRKPNKFNIIFTSDQKIKESAVSDFSKGPQKKKPDQDKKKTDKPEIEKIPFVKNVIAIASGKGGVGKSTVAVNLALSLKRIGFNVGLVDGDVYGPSIPHMMDLRNKPDIKDNLMIPIKNYGISCISIGSLIDKDQALVWRGPMITKTLYQLIRGVNWGYEDKEIDYLIIDLPPGTGDVHLSMCQQFPISGAVIVSTPQDVAVIDAVKAIDMFSKLNVPIIGLVQNMAYLNDEKSNKKTYLFGENKAKKLADDSKIKFLGDVEIDIRIRQGGDDKNPMVNSHPSSQIAFAYGAIAENITDFFK
jgi:ATP-binding protein involved in chromosome partitioning